MLDDEPVGMASGARILRLDAADCNRAASALYEGNGFRYPGENGDLMADGIRRELVMEKQLG